MSDRDIVNRLIANDEKMIYEFFFVRCHDALAYIGRHYFKTQHREPEELIGEVFEFLSADDWHKLRIFNFDCSLNSYIVIIASRYFQRKRDRKELPYNGNIKNDEDDAQSEDLSTFVKEDVEKVLKKMSPFDRFLVERILIGKEKPGDILLEAKEFMDRDGSMTTAADNEHKFAGYIYTRFNRAKKYFQQQMRILGYGN